MGIYTLPVEVVIVLLSYMTVKQDLRNFACTSKRSYELIKDIAKKLSWRSVIVDMELLREFPDGYNLITSDILEPYNHITSIIS